MYLRNALFRFWLPSQETFIYPESVSILFREDGSKSFIVDGRHLEDIDEEATAMVMSPYEAPSGEIYEGDIIRIGNRNYQVFAEEKRGKFDDYEDTQVDFYVSGFEDKDKTYLSDILREIGSFKVVGERFSGVWVEEDFSAMVDSFTAKKEEERRQQLLQKVRESSSQSNEDDDNQYDDDYSDEEEAPQPYDDTTDFDSEVIEEENYDDESEDDDVSDTDNDSTEMKSGQDSEILNTAKKDKITLADADDILKNPDGFTTREVSIKDLNVSQNDDDELLDSLEFDDDEDDDFLWDDDSEIFDLFQTKSTQGFEEVFIKTVLDRQKKLGGWASSVYHFGLSTIESGSIDSDDKKLLEMTALQSALSRIKIPSTIRVNVDNGFLKNLLSGSIKDIAENEKYKLLYTSLLDDSEPHNFIFVNENPYSQKIEARIAKEQAQEELENAQEK